MKYLIIKNWKILAIVAAIAITFSVGVYKNTPALAETNVSCIYVVQQGEYLSEIGPRVGLTWQRIYALNKSLIGNDPTKIVPGQRLVICDDGRNPPSQPIITPPPPVAPPATIIWTQQSIKDKIMAVFGSYGKQAIAVATCESSLNPLAYNQIPVYWPPQPDPHAVYVGHAAGLFQIIDATWASLSVRAKSRYEPEANIQGAYELFQRNNYNWYQSWSCASASANA